jgi:glycine betaine/proline transport system substrate-binding protein
MNRRSAISAVLAAVAVRQGRSSEPTRPVILGAVSLSFYAVVGAIVTAVLERLGHRVEIIEGTHEQIFPLLGEAKVDLMAAAWLPEGHRTYWQQYGTQSVEVAKLYDGARFLWAVPDYVPEAEVASIADLARPAVAQRMVRRIQGIGDGAAISVLSRKVLTDYSLSPLGYSFHPGTQSEWLAACHAAMAARQWMVFPTWTPQYLNKSGGLRPLRDPAGTLGSINRASLVGPRVRVDALPSGTRRALSRLSVDIDAVEEMDAHVNTRQMSPKAAALAWMSANARQVSGWFQ